MFVCARSAFRLCAVDDADAVDACEIKTSTISWRRRKFMEFFAKLFTTVYPCLLYFAHKYTSICRTTRSRLHCIFSLSNLAAPRETSQCKFRDLRKWLLVFYGLSTRRRWLCRIELVCTMISTEKCFVEWSDTKNFARRYFRSTIYIGGGGEGALRRTNFET